MTESNQVVQREPTAIQVWRADVEKMLPQLAPTLPDHISPEEFKVACWIALSENPKLLQCDRRSFMLACMKAAQDGIKPDRRQGVILPYKTRDGWIAQWIPMIEGIRALVRNSGMLKNWHVDVVQDGDYFDHRLGDDPFVEHKRAAHGGRTRKVQWVYSIATFNDGSKSYEVMNADMVEDVRKKSPARDTGPWADPIFYPEMVKKTCAKLHAKQLPKSTDLILSNRIHSALDREDEYAREHHHERQEEARRTVRTGVAATLDTFADAGEAEDAAIEKAAQAELGAATDQPLTTAKEPAELPTDTTRDTEPPLAAPAAEATEPVAPSEAEPKHQPSDVIVAAHAKGAMDRKRGYDRTELPKEFRTKARSAEAAAWIKGWDTAQ